MTSKILSIDDPKVEAYYKKSKWLARLSKTQIVGMYLFLVILFLFFIGYKDYFYLYLKIFGVLFFGGNILNALYFGIYKQEYVFKYRYSRNVNMLTAQNAINWAIIQLLINGLFLLGALTVKI